MGVGGEIEAAVEQEDLDVAEIYRRDSGIVQNASGTLASESTNSQQGVGLFGGHLKSFGADQPVDVQKTVQVESRRLRGEVECPIFELIQAKAQKDICVDLTSNFGWKT